MTLQIYDTRVLELQELLFELGNGGRVYRGTLEEEEIQCQVYSGNLSDLQAKYARLQQWRALSVKLSFLSTIVHLKLDTESLELSMAYRVAPRSATLLCEQGEASSRTRALVSLTNNLATLEQQYGLVLADFDLQMMSFMEDYKECLLHPCELLGAPCTTQTRSNLMMNYALFGCKLMGCVEEQGYYNLTTLVQQGLLLEAWVLEASLNCIEPPRLIDCSEMLNNVDNTPSEWMLSLFVLSNYLNEAADDIFKEEVNLLSCVLFGNDKKWKNKLPADFYKNFKCSNYSESVVAFCRCARNLMSHMWNLLANDLDHVFQPPYMNSMWKFWTTISPHCFEVLLMQSQSNPELRQMLCGVVNVPQYYFKAPWRLTVRPGILAFPSIVGVDLAFPSIAGVDLAFPSIAGVDLAVAPPGTQPKTKAMLNTPLKLRRQQQRDKRNDVSYRAGLLARVAAGILRPWNYVKEKFLLRGDPSDLNRLDL